MTTKVLKNLRKKSRNKPAMVAENLRGKSKYVFLAYLILALTCIGMIFMEYWVPGLAWLE